VSPPLLRECKTLFFPELRIRVVHLLLSMNMKVVVRTTPFSLFLLIVGKGYLSVPPLPLFLSFSGMVRKEGLPPPIERSCSYLFFFFPSLFRKE